MKKIVSILTALLIAATVFCFTGCPGKQLEKASVVYVIGSNADFPAASCYSSYLKSELHDLCATASEISYVVVEGEPKAQQLTIPEIPSDISKRNKEQKANKYTASVLKYIESAAASTEGANTLKALTEAANTLRASKNEKKIIRVFANGVDKSGLLFFDAADGKSIVDVDSDTVIAQLKSLSALPELTGIEVEWYGLGVIADNSEQKSLPSSAFAAYRSLWQKLLTASGAAYNAGYFNTSPISGKHAENVPSLPVINFPEDKLNPFQSTEDGVITLDEQAVEFIPDTSDFKDPQAAENAVKPMVEYLKNNSAKILICGSTAKIQDDGLKLSLSRAKAFKSLIIKLGGGKISDNRIATIGLGAFDNPKRASSENGSFKDGDINDPNRCAYIMTEDSAIASQFKAAYENIVLSLSNEPDSTTAP